MSNQNKLFQEAVESLASSMQYMIGEANRQNTQIFEGIIVSISDDTAVIQFNGKTYTLKQYGSFTHFVKETVKVFIPQGNMNLAFFI